MRTGLLAASFAVVTMTSCASPEVRDWRAELASWKPGAPWPNVPLVDDGGRHVSLHELAAPLTVGFVYTRCPVDAMCPTTMRNLARGHHESGARVLVVTLDPENDTPA